MKRLRKDTEKGRVKEICFSNRKKENLEERKRTESFVQGKVRRQKERDRKRERNR